MSDEETDLPSDVEVALTDLIESAREHARAGESDELVEVVDTMAAVARNELPEGERRDRLLHGCERVSAHVGDDFAVVTEYLRVMESLME